MLFPTLDYLVFLPLSVLVYWLVPHRFRLWVLLLASVVFYGSWSVAYLPVFLGVILLASAGGRWIARRQARNQPTGRILAAVVVALLAPLFVFKYWNWLSGDAEAALQALGVPLDLPANRLPLPVGISFYTFQALAWVVDARRKGEGEESLARFATFIAYFPQLVAGPILRGRELMPQLRNLPLLAQGQVGAGLFRIARGMVKKVLLADMVRVGMVDPLFSDPGRFTGPELLVGLYAFTLQIYCDFSGYTDIAIGSARLFGLELPENFRRPYLATSITGFWRRWHITLSLWVRHYIYFPLGGAQVSPQARVYANLMITFLVLGIWHGASWNFVIYGILHGGAMCLHRFLRKQHGRDPEDIPPGVWAWTWRFLLTFHFVVLARILFRAPDLASSWAYLEGLTRWSWVLPRFSPLAWGALATGYLAHFSPPAWQPALEGFFRRRGPLGLALLVAAVAAACMLLGTGEQLAFIYYQF